MRRHEGKIAVITGGTSGIGLATARRLVEEGAYVLITGRRQAELDAAVELIGQRVTGVQGDVANLADLDRLFESVKTAKGRIDILFANAGVGAFAPLGAITEEHFDRQFGINVRGLLFTVQKALPLMVDGGAIVLNASTAASSGYPAFSVYGACKAAVRAFARGWSVDLRDRRIRVNAISPGLTPTPGYSTSLGMTEAQVAQFVAAAIPTIPLGRPGSVDEIAAAVSFLASADASFITGIELFVDGGEKQI
jgi:NAD(P)-dependent dehydrogenase (short-subunit alcohol dehydrogenase family)